jgi:hypothetical protein
MRLALGIPAPGGLCAGLTRFRFVHELVERTPTLGHGRSRALERLAQAIHFTENFVQPRLQSFAHFAASLRQEQIPGHAAHDRANPDGNSNPSAIVHLVLLSVRYKECATRAWLDFAGENPIKL